MPISLTQKVGDNIFNYLHLLEIETDESTLKMHDVELKDMYRNWGNRNWKIREK